MSQFAFAGMSPAEVQFIRVYVNALRKHYDTIRTAIDVMNPDELNVEDFNTATRLAIKMRDLHADFDAAVRKLHRKHKTPIRQSKPVPTEDDLADLFGLSFFKLITKASVTDTPAQFVIPHEGWFSGKPNEWKNSLKAYKEAPKPTQSDLAANILSQYLSIFSKFFHINATFNKKPPFGGSKKIWPTEQDFFDDQLDDDDDEIDAPENPFDWLFGDDDEE
ncbi:MAG: hypothetical protein EBZ69_00195 [Alphaproteobacteria bacterium]|nr:hypothetical protein [Alphaproteobacteria bacterium]